MKRYAILNFFRYGCDSKEYFNATKKLRNNFNFSTWRVVSFVSAIYFIGCFISTFSVKVVKANMIVYAALAMMGILMSILFLTVLKPESKGLPIAMYTYCVALLVFGIYIGCFTEDRFPAVTFHVLLLCIPLLIIDKPYRLGFLQFLASIAFCFCSTLTKEGDVLSMDLFNGVVFMLLAQVINYYLATTRIRQFKLTYNAEIASYTDGLTKMFNRKAYVQDTEYLHNDKDHDTLVIVAMDLNGLKVINDTLGHKAGDELIVGASECIKSSFDAYGKTYRVGGDEFMAILHIEEALLKEVQTKFDKITNDWKGNIVSSISISTGYAIASEFSNVDIEELERLADERMYKEKSEYYIKHDRRASN